MVIAEKSRVRRVFSTPLGGLRLTDLYASGNGRFTKKNYSKMSDRILELLPDRKELPQLGKLRLVGAGGTARAVARYHQMIIDYPLDKLHNYSMDQNSVEQIHRTLRKMSPKQIGNIPVIGEDRAKSMVAGSIVIQVMMKKLKVERRRLALRKVQGHAGERFQEHNKENIIDDNADRDPREDRLGPTCNPQWEPDPS